MLLGVKILSLYVRGVSRPFDGNKRKGTKKRKMHLKDKKLVEKGQQNGHEKSQVFSLDFQYHFLPFLIVLANGHKVFAFLFLV